MAPKVLALLLSAVATARALQATAAPAAATASSSTDTFWAGKRVLLAGASSGLGEALANELSARGSKLVITARRADRLKSIADGCARIAQGGAPKILPMDVTNEGAILEAQAAEAAALLGGPVDVLCYAAGVGQRTTAVGTSAAGHRQIMATNFEGAVALSRAGSAVAKLKTL